MITCALEEITEIDARAFVDWANKEQAELLLEIVRGKESEASCEALYRALQGTTDADKNLADDALARAKRYTTFLAVWKEVLSAPGRPKTAVIQQI